MPSAMDVAIRVQPSLLSQSHLDERCVAAKHMNHIARWSGCPVSNQSVHDFDQRKSAKESRTGQRDIARMKAKITLEKPQSSSRLRPMTRNDC